MLKDLGKLQGWPEAGQPAGGELGQQEESG